MYNVLAVKQEKQRTNQGTRAKHANRGHMQLLKQKYVFNVLLGIRKLKKVKQVVLNVYRVPIWAAAIDATCLHFNVDECGNKGSCGVYDNGAIAIIFLYLGGIPKLLSVIFFMIGAWWSTFFGTAHDV